MRGAVAWLAAAVLAWAPAAGAQEAGLDVGMKAPELKVSKWVKGEPVEGFKDGQVYVVEFWATWCGPCRVSIPHLSELQKEYGDKVQFIGVSVWEDEPSEVEPFVEEMGEKMAYRVAKDEVPEGADGNAGAMAKGWMQAAGENGIPAAFVVDGTGRVAWIGHPMSMDEPLEKIVKGEYDVDKAASERKAAKGREKKLTALIEKLQQTGGPKEATKLLPDIEALMSEDAELAQQLAGLKFSLLLASDEAKAVAYARELAKGDMAKNAMMLNNLAWSLVDPSSDREIGDEAKAAALEIAQRADEATGHKDGNVLDTLARALFLNGKPKEAAEAQEKAIELAGDDAQPDMRDRLKEYQKAAEGK
jgi:thiol-disulfide isomerase/thioredoxin